MVVSFLVAALLGSDSLVGLARRQEFGWQRSVALTAAHALDRVADGLSLDRPARDARRALGKEQKRYDVDALLSGGEGGASSGHDAGAGTGTAGHPGSSHAPAGAGPAAADQHAATAPTPTTAATRKVPSAADPLRIYVGGDSMARELASGVAEASPSSLTSVDTDYHVSTGLSRPDFYDWPQRLAQVIVERKPDVFVLLFGANDDQNMQTAAGVLEAGSAEWLAEYRTRVAKVMDLVHQPGTTTVWVGLPGMRGASFDRDIAAIDAVYREEASKRPWISYVETRSLFAGPDGGYAEYLTGGDGQPVQMRQSDGIHWSIAGATRVGRAAWQAVAQQWGLPPG
jgi:hypothetical protein